MLIIIISSLQISTRYFTPKAMLKLILPVVVQQDLLLECKPLADWLKDDILLDKGKYILGTNSDPFLLAVEKVLMDHRMVIHNNNLPGCWVTPPSTQIIATGSDVLIDQELGSMRRAQEVAVADKKTPKMWWGGGWSRSLSFCVSLVSSCWSLSFPPPPPFTLNWQLEKEMLKSTLSYKMHSWLTA